MGFLSSLGGLFGGGKKPKLSDPTQTAATQAGLNQTAATNFNNSQGFMANKGGLFGDTQAQYDANGNLIGQSASSDLNTGALTGNFNTLATGLPGTFADYSSADPTAIMNTGMANYDALSQPGIAQGQNRIDQELANRGIPINDRIATDMQGNFDRQNALARGNVFSDLQKAMPGMQGTLISNINTMQNQPYQQLANAQGLMSNANQLNPGFANLTAQGIQAPNYMGAVQGNDQAKMEMYKADQQAAGGLLGGLAGLALTPMTGGLSNTLIGKGLTSLGGLFNKS